MVGYYGRMIPNFNKLAHPLHQLVEDSASDTWAEENTQAVRQLKTALAEAAEVRRFDPEAPVIIRTDASKHATGVVLEQKGYPVAFVSRKTTEAESKAPAYETELKAIVYALAKWRPLLLGKKVTVESDHATLAKMMTLKQVTPRLGHWLDKLAEFDLVVKHIPGDLVTSRTRYRDGQT